MVQGKLRPFTTLVFLRFRGGEFAAPHTELLLEDGGEGEGELDGGEGGC